VTDDRFALVLGGAYNRARVEALLANFHPVAFEERDLALGPKVA
jgi:hypothetical protein